MGKTRIAGLEKAIPFIKSRASIRGLVQQDIYPSWQRECDNDRLLRWPRWINAFTLGEKMRKRTFSIFSEASNFAKQYAQDIGVTVKLEQEGNSWVVFTNQRAESPSPSRRTYRESQSWHQQDNGYWERHLEEPRKREERQRATSSNALPSPPRPFQSKVARKPPVTMPVTSSTPAARERPRRLPVKDPQAGSDRDCADCGNPIPRARVQSIPDVQRCVLCQEKLEARNPDLVKRRINEGIGGTREDNKRMRAKVFGEVRNRGR